MAGYIVRRLLQAIPVLLGTTFLIYFMVFAMPGDPIIALFGEKTPPPAVVEQLRERYHLDQPFIVQYLLFLGGIFRGDLGVTFTGQPVSEILAQTFPVTLRLALLSTIFLMVGGILVGLVSGLRKGGIFDASALVVSLIFISLPIFVVAFAAQYIFAIQLGWFRTTVGPGASWEDLILPAIVLATAEGVGHRDGHAGLRSHRREQGPVAQPHRARPHPAQLAHPRRHLSRRRLRRADGRRDGHGGHLQRARRRPNPLPGDHPR